MNCIVVYISVYVIEEIVVCGKECEFGTISTELFSTDMLLYQKRSYSS